MTRTRRHARLVGAVLVAAVAGACADSGAPEQGAVQADGQLPDGHPPIAASPYEHQDAPAAEGPAAVVLETQDVTDYTYARVQANGEEIWVAGPRGGPAVGDTISLGGAMGMTDFTSSELDRTFESILFLQAWRSAPALPEGGDQGEVVEVIPASSYTYIRVETEEGEVWLAGPRVALEPGQVIAWGDGMAMRDFASNTLNRTFDVIYFVDAVQIVR